VQAQACLISGEKLVGGKRVLAVQAEALEVETWICAIEICQRVVVVAAGTPAGEDVFAIDEGVDVAAEFHVVFAERVGEVVLNLEFAVVVVARQIEALAELADAADENLWGAREDGLALAGFALDQSADFVDLAAEHGGQRENAADALIDE